MNFLENLFSGLPDGKVTEARIGVHWTAVVVETNGLKRCGLAATLTSEDGHHLGEPDVHGAGKLESMSALELASLARSSEKPLERSLGIAALNALIPLQPERWVDLNAEDVIAGAGSGRTVVVVGRFPFLPRLREKAGKLHVLELQPGPGELPAEAAAEVLPQADVLAITGMALINGTLERLLTFKRPGALTLVLGPSTPLSPVLFDHGVDIVSGSVVEEIDAVLRVVSQCGTLRQLHGSGIRLVTMSRPTLQRA